MAGGFRSILLPFGISASQAGVAPPAPPRVGWIPSKPWKPSRRAEREIKDLLEEIREKALDLKPAKRAKYEQSAADVYAAIQDAIALEEAQQARAQVERLMELLRGMARATSVASMMKHAQAAHSMAMAIEAMQSEEDEELLLLLSEF